MSQQNIRIDPDELLKKIQDEAVKKAHGQLRIFLGAAAGVGKTYAMLKATEALQQDNIDVIIGYVETHQRTETKALLPPNFEYVPLKEIHYKGSILKEFDLDAVLLRKPQVVIVDELAHTNVIGSRNDKRYQDVLELINSGISVFTALNIQHIESLNNIVEQITQIKVSETIPDEIFELADEVVLIDLPPEELIERLSEGKIYPKERIEASLKNFFRKGNLTALREMSLRKTAQKVDKQVLKYRAQEDIANVWANNDKLLLILEKGYSSEKIVRHGKNIFDKGYSQWYIAYVENPKFEFQSLREKQLLLDLLDLAKQLGAIPIQLTGVDPALAIAACVSEFNISTVMLAQYKLSLYYKLFGKSLADRLSELAPGVNINLIADEHQERHLDYIPPTPQPKKTNYTKILQKIIFFSVIYGITGFAFHPLAHRLNNENILMMYLLIMVISNKGRGRISAVISALIGTLSFDFFIVPPYFSFTAADSQYLVTFLALLTIGFTFSVINGNLRFQVHKLSKLHSQSILFNQVNNHLAGAMTQMQVTSMLPNYFQPMFHAKFCLFLPNLDEQLEFKCGEKLPGCDESIIAWVFNNSQSAGLNTNTFATHKLFYIPILSKVRGRGVLVIKPDTEIQFFLPEIQNLLNNFLEQLVQ